jgi:broad specificity phosphatase PhoE
MKMRRTVISLLLFTWCFGGPLAYGQRALFLVRHAERADDSADTALSPKGEARAASLAKLLRDAGISAIYVTQFRRTAQTAGPLAELLKIAPTAMQAKDIAGMVTKIRTDHAHHAVLVVGHSDTLPNIIKAFGSQENVEIAHDEFDALFVVVPRSNQEPLLLRLRY